MGLARGCRGQAAEQVNPHCGKPRVGLIWGCWHIPLFFIESAGQYHLSLLIFLLTTFGMSILHTWIYNKTGKNLAAAWLLHAMLGASWEVFPISQPGVAGYQRVFFYVFIAASLVALIVLMIEGPKLGYQARRSQV